MRIRLDRKIYFAFAIAVALQITASTIAFNTIRDLFSSGTNSTIFESRLTTIFILAHGFIALIIFALMWFVIRHDKARYEAKEDELRRLATAVSQAAETIVITDTDGTIQYVNPAFEHITGYTMAEALGKNPRILRSGYQGVEFYKKLWNTINEGKTWSGRFTNRRKDGSFYEEEATISPVMDEHGRLSNFIAVKQDITARVRAEAQVLSLNAELKNTVEEIRMANHDLEAFSFSVSHDLRAPLQTVGGFAALLEEERDRMTQEEFNDAIRSIRHGTTKMTMLIEELLAFARLGKQEMSRTEIDMTALVREVYADLEPQRAGRSVRFTLAPLPAVHGDIGMMRQAIVNLLSNAIKYSRKISDASIEFGADTIEGVNTYFVRDNGAGFDMQQADKLFKAFQRLHSSREFEGTGVGLAIVQRVIERHGGRVWAEAIEGKGATFYFTVAPSA